MFSWGQTGQLRLAIVLDEAHRLAKDATLPKLMKEGRKFGVAVLVASQGLDDFHPDVLANAGTKILYWPSYPQSRKAAGFLRTRTSKDLSDDLEKLPVGSAYVQTPTMPTARRTRMLRPTARADRAERVPGGPAAAAWRRSPGHQPARAGRAGAPAGPVPHQTAGQ
jgi:DNA helicase HerA-like ATPase